MGGLILDSSVPIKGEREKTTVADLLRQIRKITPTEDVGLTSIGVTELFHGIYRAETPVRAENRKLYLQALLTRLPVFDYTLGIAELAGRIDGQQTRQGHIIPFVDLLIGATALFHGYSLLTVNVRHFRMIPNLNVIPF
jgi:predicted nucleic acid-binding protein